jgi:hypothetical protein
MGDDLAREGTISYFAKGEHSDWATNNNSYNFPNVEQGPIIVSSRKNPDKTVFVQINGPFGNSYDFREPIPLCDARGLHVAITWANNEVILYLNGKKIRTRHGPRTKH